MNNYDRDFNERPIIKSTKLKIFCYICAFSGIALGWGPPILCAIIVEVKFLLIDKEKYDVSWYEKLRMSTACIAALYIMLTLVMYY